MPSHKLILDKRHTGGEWLLQWNEETLKLDLPDGSPAFDMDWRKIHHVIDLYELDAQGKICFRTPGGELKFKRDEAALRDVRALVLHAMKCEPGFQERYERLARKAVGWGFAAFFVCGGLFAIYCWWASWAPDPPRGSWIYYVGSLIHLILLVLLAGALGGPYLAFIVWRRARQLRRVEEPAGDRAIP